MLLRRWALRGVAAAGTVVAVPFVASPLIYTTEAHFEDFKKPAPDAKAKIDSVPTREAQVKEMQAGKEFDVLVIGCGATGSGAALDAVTRGLKTACVDRGDFANETSSRSSKLLWGGSKYLGTCFVELLSFSTLTDPIGAVTKFISEFKMVLDCHRERTYIMENQPHLVNWLPLAIPFTSWISWPPPFGHPALFCMPLIGPIFIKLYDALSGFHCPPSFLMGPTQATQYFPQLTENIKYAAVFYEGQHNDARTATALALTAAAKGATIANHVEVTGIIGGGPEGATATGVTCVDKLSGKKFSIKAKAIVFAGGAFTDSLRQLDEGKECKRAVKAGQGVHIVLPGYYSPNNMGLADLRTSRGAFLFFLPWKGSTIVGTTDKKGDAVSSPHATEDEIQYLLNEVSRYLSDDVRVRRSDVLSAWSGWRPLYKDPKAPPDSPVSRAHVIETNPSSGVTFVTGGKWVIYREMAEHVIDTVIERKGLKPSGPCVTPTLKLIGSEGYEPTLKVQLIQQFGVDVDVAEHLLSAYGACAWDVCASARPTGRRWPRYGNRLVESYPFIEAEVDYAVKEYARTVKDVLGLRMRLAFLNIEAAREAVPRVAALMGKSLGWGSRQIADQEKEAYEYLAQFGGPVADKAGAKLKNATFTDLKEIFKELDADGSGFLDMHELDLAARKLGFPFANKAACAAAFAQIDFDKNGKITMDEFVDWWNGAHSDEFRERLQTSLLVTPSWEG